MVVIFLYETRWHPDLHDVCFVLEYSPQSGFTRIRLERIVINYELTGAEVEWSEPSVETGRMTLTMRLARVHFYELLAELVDVPDVRSIVRERFERVKASSPS
jgi:hypothetical protein